MGAGGMRRLQDDEFVVDAPDDYEGLPLKTKEILKWSLRNGYDFTFLCDTDSFLIVQGLMACGFEKYDYCGRFGRAVSLGVPYRYTDSRGIVEENHYLTASGGLGYFLSRKAAEIVVSGEPTSWAEDMWVAQVMGPLIAFGQIKAKDLDEFECQVSWHFHHGARLPRPMTTPEMQYESYRLGNPSLMYKAEQKKVFESRKK
jgi:hypothetical protein